MACTHKTCQCEIEGCGLRHPARWTPAMTISINGHEYDGDDVADCVAHYLLAMGYPRDRPEHLRRIAESQAERVGPPPQAVRRQARRVTQK